MKERTTVWAPDGRTRLDVAALAGGPFYVLEPLPGGNPGDLIAREVEVFASPPTGGPGRTPKKKATATKKTEA